MNRQNVTHCVIPCLPIRVTNLCLLSHIQCWNYSANVFLLSQVFELHHFYFFNFYLIIFVERGWEGEKRERNISWWPLAHAPTRDQTHNSGMCPDQESNRWPFTLQDDASQDWITSFLKAHVLWYGPLQLGNHDRTNDNLTDVQLQSLYTFIFGISVIETSNICDYFQL